jgi:hypothetical protein
MLLRTITLTEAVARHLATLTISGPMPAHCWLPARRRSQAAAPVLGRREGGGKLVHAHQKRRATTNGLKSRRRRLAVTAPMIA